MVIEKIYVLVIYVSVVQHFSLMFIYPSFPPKTGKGMILAGFSLLDLVVNIGKWPIQIFLVWLVHGLVVQKADNAVQRINCYPMDKG